MMKNEIIEKMKDGIKREIIFVNNITNESLPRFYFRINHTYNDGEGMNLVSDFIVQQPLSADMVNKIEKIAINNFEKKICKLMKIPLNRPKFSIDSIGDVMEQVMFDEDIL